MRPTLFIERDPNNGPTYIRVLEQVHNPFAPNTPQRTICNQTVGPNPGLQNEITGNLTTLIANVDATRVRNGVELLNTNLTMIYDYSFVRWDAGGESIHGAGIKIGDDPTNAATFVQRVFADGQMAPQADYDISNVDFIGVELSSGPLYFRDVTGRNFGDAGIDTKSGPVYIMNATFDTAHRMIRAWDGVEIVLVNSIVNSASPAGLYTQVWLYDGTATVRHYNTLWCFNVDEPSASNPDCRSDPWIVESDQLDDNQIPARIIKATSNPLPNIAFFQTQVEEIVLEYSTNNGSTWQRMNVPNTGGPGSAPVGDPRYRIPFDLSAANYQFRAEYRQGGSKVGDTSAVIDENGNTVP